MGRRRKGEGRLNLILFVSFIVIGLVASYPWTMLGIILVLLALWLLVKLGETLQDREREKIRTVDIKEVDQMAGHEFEEYIASVLRLRGYDAWATQGSHDFGIDVVASKGDERIAIQVKRMSSNLSRRAVSDAVGGMAHYGCNKAMVVTNSYFSKSATALAKANKCILIDREGLIEWILEVDKARHARSLDEEHGSEYQHQQHGSEDEDIFSRCHSCGQWVRHRSNQREVVKCPRCGVSF